MGSDRVGDGYESLAALVAFAIAASAKHRETHYCYAYVSRARTAAVCDDLSFMHEIDGSEGETTLLA